MTMFSRSLCGCLPAAAILAVTVSAPPAPAYTNSMVLDQQWWFGIGDPFVLKYNGTYYLVPSTPHTDQGVRMWTSRNLVNWTYRGQPQTGLVESFAPEVTYWNGIFYMYTSPSGLGHYVTTATDPLGPYTLRTGNLGHAIDGSVFIDDNGQWYFSHAEWGGLRIHQMIDPFNFGPEVVGPSMLSMWTEGSFILKRKGKYYLTYTGNHVVTTGYRVDYAVSLVGPMSGWQPASRLNPILLNTETEPHSLGHSMTVRGPDLDAYYIVYHGNGRRLCVDRIAFNGDKMVVLGPTDFAQPDPDPPAFADYFDRTSIGTAWTPLSGGSWFIDSGFLAQTTTGSSYCYRQVTSSASSAANYTAEFNCKEVGHGTTPNPRFGAVVSHVNESNYGLILLNPQANRLQTLFRVNGIDSVWQDTALPAGHNHTVLHHIRVEKSGDVFSVFVDGLLKQQRTITGLSGGKVGYLAQDTNARFGHVAFSNHVDNSSDYDRRKPVPGAIEAVHYRSGGDGVGYHDTTPGNSGAGYRADDVDKGTHPEGGFTVSDFTAGEWLKYLVKIRTTDTYNLGLRYASAAGAEVRVLIDGAVVASPTSLPATGGSNAWTTAILEGLNLTSGDHALILEATMGSCSVYTLKLRRTDTVPAEQIYEFSSGFGSGWNFSDGAWTATAGTIQATSTGKRTLGSTQWTDYVVEADIRPIDRANSGIIFRVSNPSDGLEVNPEMAADYHQGYFAGIGPSGVFLHKVNYGYTYIGGASAPVNLGQWHHLKVLVQGNRYHIFLDDMTVPKCQYTDPDPFITGKVGLRAQASTAEFDNFRVGGDVSGDFDPPVPNGMTWASVPAATGPGSITMTATTAFDPSGVEYYFECTAGNGHDSGWQDGSSYEDGGLSRGITYSYRVRARDKSPRQNQTAWSSAESVVLCANPVFDSDDDADVDQDDFGAFQTCYTQLLGVAEGCICFDINRDDQINGADRAAFIGCMSGPGGVAAPTCDD